MNKLRIKNIHSLNIVALTHYSIKKHSLTHSLTHSLIHSLKIHSLMIYSLIEHIQNSKFTHSTLASKLSMW